MTYQQNPNTGTLLENDHKQSDTHPDYKGDLLISRELLEKIAKYGEAKIEISAWVGQTKKGKPKISITCKEPYQKPQEDSPKYKAGTPPEYQAPEVIHEPTPHRSGALVGTDRGVAFTEYREPPAPTPAPKAPPSPEKYLAALKDKIALVQNSVQFQELYNKIKNDEVWAVFESVPAIAQEATNILAEHKKKFAPNIPKEPSDLSDLISKIDVEFQRLKLHPKADCLARWGKSRQELSEEELQIYLDELRIAEPMPPSDDFF
jgi:hypothetical protein